MAVISSIQHNHITNDYNEGANCLKNYLRYAEAVSIGNVAAARHVLHGLSPWHDTDDADEQAKPMPVADQLAAALVQQGFQVDREVGQSHFRCDLAIRCAGDSKYRLGILLDDDAYYDQSDVLERDMMRPKLLRNFGWSIAHVLAKDWYADRTAVLARLVRRIEEMDEEDESEERDASG